MTTTTMMMASPKVLVVLLRRLEARRAGAARAWQALQGRLGDEEALRDYVRQLRQCERLHAILTASATLRAAILN